MAQIGGPHTPVALGGHSALWRRIARRADEAIGALCRLLTCATVVSELARLRLPHRSVVGEDDSSGVEGLETLDPVRYRWENTSVAVVRGACHEEVAPEGRRRVMALAGDYHRPVAPVHDDRLVARSVSRSRYDEHAPQDLALAIEELVSQPGGIDEFGQRVVRSSAASSSTRWVKIGRPAAREGSRRSGRNEGGSSPRTARPRRIRQPLPTPRRAGGGAAGSERRPRGVSPCRCR